MASPISIPRLGWNMDEGVFIGWIKHDGDEIAIDDPLFTLEGEKATEDIASLASGILRILPGGPKPGDTVAVGAVIGQLVAKGEAAPMASRPSNDSTAAQPASATRNPEMVKAPLAKAKRHEPNASPRARRVAGELNVDWTQLTGSGSTGRIRERDVRAAASARSSIPLSTTRQKISHRLQESLRNTVPVTLTTTADATNLVQLYRQFQIAGKAGSVLHPTYTDILVKLAGGALLEHPHLNAHTDGKNFKLCSAINIGIAVETEAGLLVPVIRDVPGVTLKDLSSRSRELVARARQGTLKASEMQNGTFTVSNLGSFGVDAFTPILNPPQCGILGVGRIHRRPAAHEDKIVIRDEVTLSLTFDHRSVDGAPAARFLQTLRERVENPAPWLIS